MPLKLLRATEETFYVAEPLIYIGPAEIELLKHEVNNCTRKRVRICTHQNIDAALHEMFVCYTRETQIAPHKHVGKEETFYIVEGDMSFILYNDTGDVKRIVEMGDARSGKPFCIRVPMDAYHKAILHSKYCVLHESTPGPFSREDTIWATWK